MIEGLKTRFKSDRIRLLFNWSVYSIGGFIPQAVSVMLLPVFTRYLSPYDYGVLSYTAMLSSFFTLAGSLSIQTFIIRHYYEFKTDEEIREFFGTVVISLVLYDLVLLGLALIALPPVFEALSVQVPFRPFMQLALISVVIEIAAIIPMSYFRVREEALKYVALAAAVTVLNGALSVYLVVGLDMGLLGRYYGQLGANIVMLAVYLFVIWRICRFKWRSEHVRKALFYCIPLVPAQFLASFSSMSDRLVLERFIPLDELGLYSVGFGVASSVVFLMSGIYTAVQPRICQLASRSELDARMPSIKKYFLFIVMTLMCAMIALSPELVAVLAAPKFHESYKLASVLVISIILQAFLTNVPSLYLMANNKTRYEAPVRFVGASAGFIALLAMAYYFGVYGAAAAAVVTALATLFCYNYVLKGVSRVRWRFGQDVLMMAAACAIGFLIQRVAAGPVLLTAGVKISLVLVTAALFAWRLVGVPAFLAQKFSITGG